MHLINADALEREGWYLNRIIQTDKNTMEYQTKKPTEIDAVEPERKTGRWVNNIHDLPVCDQCGYMTPYDRAIDDYEYGNFCPNCGAKMRGKQDG
jgi:predicted RNA-binding Zn-ribbon protein involved in translation (DUF1610 family)